MKMDLSGIPIRRVFQNVYPVRSRLLSMLSASNLSAFCYSIWASPSKQEKEKYLNPIRYMGELQDWLSNAVMEGCIVMLVGTDVNKLISRIRNPLKYWIEKLYETSLTIWPVVVHPDMFEIEGFATYRTWGTSIYALPGSQYDTMSSSV